MSKTVVVNGKLVLDMELHYGEDVGEFVKENLHSIMVRKEASSLRDAVNLTLESDDLKDVYVEDWEFFPEEIDGKPQEEDEKSTRPDAD